MSTLCFAPLGRVWYTEKVPKVILLLSCIKNDLCRFLLLLPFFSSPTFFWSISIFYSTIHYTVEPIFNNTSNSDDHCYNDRSENSLFFLYLSQSIYFCNNEYLYSFLQLDLRVQRKESTKIFHGKKIWSILFCLHCYGTN